MISPEEFNREYGPVYKYTSPPIMPGIRKLCGVPEERVRLSVNLDAPYYNFVPSNMKEYSNPRCMPMVYPANGVEGFNSMSPIGNFICRLIIFGLVLALCYYLYVNYKK